METDTTENKESEQKKTKKKKFSLKAHRQSAMLVIGGLIFGLLIGVVITSPTILGAAVYEGDIKDSISNAFPQVTIIELKDAGSLYEVLFEIPSPSGAVQSYFYATKDGKYIITGTETGDSIIPMSDASIINLPELNKKLAEETKEPEGGDAVEIPKTDKPEVELFVMSYCPYGLQMEKAVIPVQKLLGEYADFSIKFVDYVMHDMPEIDENTRDYCIQKDYPDKFWDYLTCFISDGSYEADGETVSEACMASLAIDKAKVNACVIGANNEFKISELYADKTTWKNGQYPQYNIHKELNEKYSVAGSPTLVINGVISNVQRTPEAVKQAVCDSFTVAPDVCSTELSNDGFEAGFGLEAGSTGADGGCGA